MVTIQRIEHEGQLVALVAGRLAVIAAGLSAEQEAVAKAKCLYALEVQAGQQPGPYSDAAASRYAQRAMTLSRVTRPRASRRR